jgi:hypothetical protein
MSFHPRTRAGFVAGACLLLAHVACSVPPPTTASYFLSAPLVAVGGGAAYGKVEAHLSMLMRSLYVEVYGLVPGAGYFVAIDGASVANFLVDADGTSNVQRSIETSLVDPRGRRIAIVDDAGDEVLVVADASDPAYFEIHDAPLSAFGAGTGRSTLISAAGTRALAVRLDDVDPGAYDLHVDGEWRASLDASTGHAKTVVDASGLDLDAAIEVQQDGVGMFAGSPRAPIFGLDWCVVGLGVQAFESLGAGTAVASLRTSADCGRRLEVTLLDVLEGDYELVVGGTERGVISVGIDENGETTGEIFFDSDERGSAQLDFDPLGAPFEVRQGAAVHFAIGAFEP